MILDRILSTSSAYVIRQIVRPLLAALAIGLLVLLSERMVRLLDITLGKKNSFTLVFEMLSYLVPHYLGLALPASLFLGLLFGFNKLSKASEVDAFMASGIGLHQLSRPVLGLAVLFTFAGVLIFGYVQPHARYAYRALVHTVKNVEIFYLAEEGVFMQAGSRTFILDKLSRRDNRFERIFLFEDKGAKGSETVSATTGALIEVEGETRPVLRLEQVHQLQVLGWPAQERSEPLPKSRVAEFKNVDTPLGKVRAVFFRLRGNDEREMTLDELIEHQDTPPKGATKLDMKAELHRRVVSILTILLLPILAIPFALGRRRGQRAYRFAVALILLIAYNEIINQGALAVRVQGASPYVALWLPFVALAAFSGWRYYRACFTLRADGLEPIFDRIGEFARWCRHQVTDFSRQL
jgi:lipopolysaccharide export system permease protein